MTLSPQQIPDYISPLHLCTPSRFAGEKRLVSVLRSLAAKSVVQTVLDIGCGGGEYRFLFPGCQYTGIDIIDHNFMQKSEPETTFRKGDAGLVPAESSAYDLVFSTYAFEYFPEPLRALGEMNRVLKDNGTIMICLPSGWIKGYEVFPDLLRACGLALGAISAMPGVRHYSPKHLGRLAAQAGLSMSLCVPIYGWATFIYKLLAIPYRIGRHLISRKFTDASPYPLHADRRVSPATSRNAWSEICRSANSAQTYADRLYIRILHLCSFLDKLTVRRPVVEYIALLHKSR